MAGVELTAPENRSTVSPKKRYRSADEGEIGGHLLPELFGELCHPRPGGKRESGMNQRESSLPHLRSEDLVPGYESIMIKTYGHFTVSGN